METADSQPSQPSRFKSTLWVLLGVGVAALAGLVLAPDRAPPKAIPSPTPSAVPSGHLPRITGDPLFPPIESIFDLSNLTVPLEQIRRSRQPKDGFKSLTNPATSPAAEASFLEPGSRVVGVTVEGVSRAYPINVLNWHELINDRLGKTDLVITYCSLCDSVTVLDRRLAGKTYEFGISGLIYQSNMLIYDRTDQALWSQLTSTAISGPLAGRPLRHIDGWELTTFGAWRAAHPGSTVVSYQTGENHPYSSDPHGNYFATDTLDKRFQDLPTDPRIRNKARIIGVKYGAEARAYPIDALKAAGRTTIHDQIGGEPVEIAIDPATGTVRIVRIPAAALVAHTLWFAWAAHFPQTEVYQPSSDKPAKR